MEKKIPRNLLPPATYRRRYPPNPNTAQSINQETSAQTTSDLGIESAFANLRISQDFHHALSFSGFLVTNDGDPSAVSLPLPMANGENQQPPFGDWGHGNDDGTLGPFGFVGAADQNRSVGPQRTVFSDSGENFDPWNDHPLIYQRRQRFSDANCALLECCSLHSKQPPSINERFDFSLTSSFDGGKFKSLCKKPPSINERFDFSVTSSFDGGTLKSLYKQTPSINESFDFSVTSSFDGGKLKSSLSNVYNQQHLHQLHQQITMESMRGKIVSCARDQILSEILRLKLEDGLSDLEIEIVLSEVMGFLGELMKNHFGGQFLEKLFVACNEEQRTRIIWSLTRSPFKLINICLNSNGARSMQALLQKLIAPQQISLIICALTPAAIPLAHDSNGQHVVSYCIKNFSEEDNIVHLFNDIASNCLKLATNKSGCCVLQSCLEKIQGEARVVLIKKIIICAVELSQDPYGNYVVQHLFGMRIPGIVTDLVRRFQGSFAYLSFNKYASNVVEKILDDSGEMHTSAIIMELISSPNASKLLVDPFANYVIQSALRNSQEEAQNALVNLIHHNDSSMQSNLYGKKILAVVQKMKFQNA